MRLDSLIFMLETPRLRPRPSLNHTKTGVLSEALTVPLESPGAAYKDKSSGVVLTAAVHPLDKKFTFPLAAVQSRSSNYESPALRK